MDQTVRQRLFCRLASSCHFDAREMAAFLEISARQLDRYFQQDFGRAPQEWLSEQRMLAAAELLRVSESIKRVRLEFGISRANNFAREFRRVHGLTPRGFLLRLGKYRLDVRI